MLTPHGYTFTVTARGQKWRGTWAVEGKDVCVSSAFGSARVPKGRKKPTAVAEEALKGLVDDWAARR
ncbi:hypothetical protein [Caulobacter sp. Root1472]|uniref:hypothetical protein n=1 Tax=Caulobacter sp. Root1472 TaxID=1736470 RepID=UPI0006F77A0C|nr:hypothetical protein [Caulobacter sp. Root1472]KQZ31742.1 hypothetical protein ASD47_15840 [Caulobacter sp. Root1472]